MIYYWWLKRKSKVESATQSVGHAKANNKYMKKFDKIKSYSYSMHLDKNISYGKAMAYKLTVDEFEWDETSNLQTKPSKIEKTLILIRF